MNAHTKPRPRLAPGMICTDTRDGSTVRLIAQFETWGDLWRVHRFDEDGAVQHREWVVRADHLEHLDELMPGDDPDAADMQPPDDQGPIGILYRALAELDAERATIKGLIDGQRKATKHIVANRKAHLRAIASQRREIVAAIQKLAEAD